MENSNKKELNPEELELVNGGSWDEVMKNSVILLKRCSLLSATINKPRN